MAITFQEKDGGKILHVHVSGKVRREDYEEFAPYCDRLIRDHGKISILLEMTDFHGWTAGAMWEDIKWDFKHFSDIERVAMVGESQWQKGMSVFCKPFTTAKVRYFDHAHAAEASAWVEGVAAAPSK